MRTPFLCASLMCLALVHAQSPDWLWAQRAGGVDSEEALATATDADGNVLIAGYFKSANTTFGTTTLTHQAYEDVFLTKYDGAGNVLWARAATGNWYDEAFGVATDADGNAIVVGFFSSDTLHLGASSIVNAGSGFNGFVAKYAPNGNLLWARAFGGSLLDHCYAVTTDAAGNIYVTGDFTSTNITFAGTTLVPTQFGEAVLLKYDAGGNEQWAATATGDYHNEGTSVATDASGNVIMGGNFHSSVLDLGGTTLTNAGDVDGFFARYSAAGTLQWARQVGDLGSESITGVSTDASGNIGVAGYYASDALTIGTTTLDNATGGEETFIAKFDAAGSPLWAVTAAGGGNQARGIAADGNNDFVVTGFFESDALTFGAIDASPADYAMDVFVVKCNGGGAFQWATTAGSDGQDKAYGIATDAAGGIFVSGWFSGTDITFGATTLTNVPGSDDLFVAKLDGTTGIAESAASAGPVLYPNPATTQCTLRLPGGATTGTFTLHDALGRTVAALPITGALPVIDLGPVAPGAYAFTLTTDAGRTAGRVVIAR